MKKAYRMGSSKDRRSLASQECAEHDGPEEIAERVEGEGNTSAAEGTARYMDGARETGTADDTCDILEEAGKGARAKQHGPWLAYAFVVFRDKEEASEAMAVFDGARLAEGWVAKVSRVLLFVS